MNPNRFNQSAAYLNDVQAPIADLNITEASLNELLTNVTLSTLALNAWRRTIPVTMTQFRNTYQFSRPIYLILPYSLCLVIGAVVVALGLFSMYENKVAATDGGFLMVMLTTRGATHMDRLVAQQGLVGPHAISQELKDLKVRFGELVTPDRESVGRSYGFGTTDETLCLRERR